MLSIQMGVTVPSAYTAQAYYKYNALRGRTALAAGELMVPPGGVESVFTPPDLGTGCRP